MFLSPVSSLQYKSQVSLLRRMDQPMRNFACRLISIWIKEDAAEHGVVAPDLLKPEFRGFVV
jgi:hypothetical protein